MRNRGYGIIFVHGIVGNPGIFDFLKPSVPAGYEQIDLVLDGHGGDALAFSLASMSRWNEQVRECVDRMSARCDTILAVGHSMGCLLIMNQAACGKLSRLFLMNPPMRIRPRLRLLTNVIKVATGRDAHDPVASAAKAAYGISLDFNPLHYYGWPARYIELFREIYRVRKDVLGQIECPVWAILSKSDEMVSPSAAACFAGLREANVVELPDSAHFYYTEGSRDLIRREFKTFVGMAP